MDEMIFVRAQKRRRPRSSLGGHNFKGWRVLMSMLFLISALLCQAQNNKGKITEVDSDDGAPVKPTLHYYDKHGEKLETPVLFLAELDTVKNNSPRSPYPLINGFTFGINFGDAILSLIGQNHYSYDISAMLSFHNWFFPVIEAGVGWGNHTESGDSYKVKAKPSFYAKIGLNYNFLYKSKPDYMAYFGLRFGFSNHRWDITDIKPSSPDTSGSDVSSGGASDEGSGSDQSSSAAVYTPSINDIARDTGVTEMLNQSCVSIYGEVVAGLKVKIAGPFSLGWNVRYRVYKHSSKNQSPWFIPGYGSGPLGVNICAYLTFGEKPRRDAIAVPDELPAPEPAPGSKDRPDSKPRIISGDKAESGSSADTLPRTDTQQQSVENLEN